MDTNTGYTPLPPTSGPYFSKPRTSAKAFVGLTSISKPSPTSSPNLSDINSVISSNMDSFSFSQSFPFAGLKYLRLPLNQSFTIFFMPEITKVTSFVLSRASTTLLIMF